MEKELTTKEKIICESLRLFSSKGYNGVSMREIATAVGIKGASIYNHFKGKEDIFLAIFSEMTKQYDEAATSINLTSQPTEQVIHAFLNIDESQLLSMAEYLFSFFTQNEFAVMFRKLIISEQHKSPIAAKCLKEYYLEAPVKYQSQIFKWIQKQGGFKDYDADTMALHFYSSIYYVLCKYDLGFSYEECLQQIKNHVHTFCLLYSK